jgi:hypothetical protein
VVAWGKTTIEVGALVFAVLGVGCTRTEFGLVPNRCLHPTPHAVRTSREAILATREAWYCMQPGLKRTDEATWLLNTEAELEGDRWHTGPRLPAGYAGGGLNMDIAASDGQVLRVFMTQ